VSWLTHDKKIHMIGTQPQNRRIGYARVSTVGRHRYQPGRLMIAVLGGLADVERDLIRTRTAERRSRATKRGQRMGRKPKLTEAQQAAARLCRFILPVAPSAARRSWRSWPD
jgi:DNA invertase Pin-like site-specific DNA recombinase